MDKIQDYVLQFVGDQRVFSKAELAAAATEGTAGGSQYEAVNKLAESGFLFEVGEGLYVYGGRG